MSGRGRGHRGRSSRAGGRGRGEPESSSQSSQAAKPAARKTLADHVHAIRSAKQPSDCSVFTAFIINHIRKILECGDDIGDALESRMETVFTAPALQPVDSALTGDPKILQEKQFETLCRAEVTTHVTRKDKCQANKGKAHALICSQCSKAMQHKLQSRTDCKSTVKGDTIKLRDAILEHSMSCVENKCHVSIVADGIKNILTCNRRRKNPLLITPVSSRQP